MPAPTSLLKGFAKTVATVKPKPGKRLLISDPDARGLYLRVTPKGHKSYTVVTRDPSGKQVWAAVGDCSEITLEEARSRATKMRARVKAGQGASLDSLTATPILFASVCDNFMQRHVIRQGLLSQREIERIFAKYVLPHWGERQILSIKRGDVARLLDGVEDNHGPVMADRVLATVSKLFNWFAAREDEYSSPVVRGMGRSKGRERARTRILDPSEVRLIWQVCAEPSIMGDLVKFALLSGQRRSKVVSMQWDDIRNGIWTIPVEAREKASAGAIKLSSLALEIIEARPRLEANPYVFAGRGSGPIVGLSKLKRNLDIRLAAANEGRAIGPWVFHDLRRTAKSLMSRAGVRPDVSERVLGHVISGVEGVYDRHDYFDQKATALALLAEQVKAIVAPQFEATAIES